MTQKPAEVPLEPSGHTPLSDLTLSHWSFLGLSFSSCEMGTLGCILPKVPFGSDRLFLGADGSFRCLSSGSPLPKLGRPGSLLHIVPVLELLLAARDPGELFSLSPDHSAQRPTEESQLPRECHESLVLTTQDIPLTPVSSLWQQRNSVNLAILGAGTRWRAGVRDGGPVQQFKAVPGEFNAAVEPHLQESQDENQKRKEQEQTFASMALGSERW